MLEFTGNCCARVVNMEKGNLFIISTPIGNLSDISLRALDVLKEVDLVLSEDLRKQINLKI